MQSIDHATIRLRNLACGIEEGMRLPLWADYAINERGPLTGDIAAGSNTLTRAQGSFPAIGERLDFPLLPTGTYVTAVDPTARTIRFSNANTTGRSYTDYTII